MFGIASSTAQESMLEFLLTAQVFPGVSLLTAQLTKCDGVFSNQKGLLFWNGGEYSAGAIQSKAEGQPLPRKTPQFFFQKTTTRSIRSKAEEELIPCPYWSIFQPWIAKK